MRKGSASIIAGDIALFEGQGVAFEILSRALKFFEREWDRWGWHMAIIWAPAYEGWYILEATGQGVKINYYSNETLREKDVRTYRWLDKQPTQKKMNEFLASHIDKAYDIAVYFWTGFQYLVRHFLNRPIPRLLDDRWTCWELAFQFCEDMGKPIGSRFDCPLITDFLKGVSDG